MLDNCSQGLFVHVDVLKQLEVKSIKTTLSLKTLHGGRLENTSAIAGMRVKEINRDCNCLMLSKLCARKDLPVDKEE